MWNGRELTFPPKQYGYTPGNSHIPPEEKENHLQNCLGKRYVSSLEGIVSEFGRVCVVLTSKEVAKFWPKFHVGLVPEGSNEWLKLKYSETMNHMFCNQYQIEIHIFANDYFSNMVSWSKVAGRVALCHFSAHQPGKTIQSNRLGWEGDDAIRMFHSESPCKQLQNKAIINYLFTTVVNRY